MGEVSVLIAIVAAIAATIAGFVSAAKILSRFYASREEVAVLNEKVNTVDRSLEELKDGQHEILIAVRNVTCPLVVKDKVP